MKVQEVQIPISEKELKDFQKYLYERENADATIQKYGSDLKKFYEYLGKEKMINKEKLLKYKKWLMSRYAVRSVNSMLTAVNQFLEFLDVGFLKVKIVKMQKSLFLPEEKELTKKEFQELVLAARKGKKEWLALVMEAIAATGIRISELRYFTVEHVRKGKAEIYNKGKYRRIFIPQKIQKKLLIYAKKQNINKGSIFVNKYGKPKDRSFIWKEMKKLKDQTGIQGNKIFPHNLRHLFARIYYRNTKDIAGLADLLGHSNMNVTRIYTANTGIIYLRQLNQLKILEI